MAHAFGIQPPGRREFDSMRGNEPYVRRPEEGASRVPNAMYDYPAGNSAGRLGSGSGCLRPGAKTATVSSLHFDPVFSDRPQRRFSSHI